MTSRLSLAAKLYSIFALFALADGGDRRAVRLQHPPQRRADACDRDRQSRRAECRTRQFAGLCGRDGVARRLHVDRTRRGEEVRRRAAQVQRQHPQRREDDGRGSSRPTMPSSLRPSRSGSSSSSSSARSWCAAPTRFLPAAGREWGDNDANRSVRSALNKDLEALSKVYVERGRRICRADRNQPSALLRPDLPRRLRPAPCRARGHHHRPLDRPSAVAHHRDHQAGRRGRRQRRGAAHRARRRDRRAGARHQDFPGGDGAQPQPHLAGFGRILGAPGASQAYRSLGRRVPAGDRRRAACADGQCLGHAQHRPDHQPRRLRRQ